MSDVDFNKIAIVGAGMMGRDIGLDFARFGYEVSLMDQKPDALSSAMLSIREQLDLMVETELISAEVAESAISRIHTTTDMEDCVAGADHVVEAVPEVLETKQQVLASLDEICPPSVTLASNTSSLSIDNCAAKAVNHPERILTAHYWQPAHLIPLVEVIGGTKTDPLIIQRVARLLRKLRKRVVIQEHELPSVPAGWGNAMQWVLAERAKKLVDEGCTPQIVDDLMRFGFGRRLAYTAQFFRVDIIGLEFANYLAQVRGEKLWAPYQEMVDRGEFGMSSGKGFYDWSGNQAKEFHRDFNMELIRLLKRDMERGDI